MSEVDECETEFDCLLAPFAADLVEAPSIRTHHPGAARTPRRVRRGR